MRSAVRTVMFPVAWLAAAVAAQDSPYAEIPNWAGPPARQLGAVSWTDVDADGNVWIAERCGANSCVGRDGFAPIHSYDSGGRWLRSFGAGMFVFPHGLHVDADGNIWVTDAGSEGGRGHQVFKFSPEGEVLMALGEAGVAGAGPGHFSTPTDVVVAANGDVFVADGHARDSNNRIVKLSSDGRFIASWGMSGSGPGEFLVPHAVAIDAQGRLFVADRDNNRIQIFDQDGGFVAAWSTFGRPSGLFVAADDTLYVSDNQSNAQRNPGWHRGIRIGRARDGSLTAFIPDPAFDADNAAATGAHGLSANTRGEIFGGEVGAQMVRQYVPR